VEEIKQYKTGYDKLQESDTGITFTQLAKYVLQVYCMPKIMRDVDKPDPLTESMYKLRQLYKDEFVEYNGAYLHWKDVSNETVANETLEEIADLINILLFQAGKVAGYKRMERK